MQFILLEFNILIHIESIIYINLKLFECLKWIKHHWFLFKYLYLIFVVFQSISHVILLW